MPVRRLLVAALMALGSLQCAVLAPERRVLTTALDEHLTPPTPAGRAACVPFAIPIGLAALSLDGLVINPVLRIPDSVDNANVVFEAVPFTGFGEILVLPMRIITYPVIFVGSLLFYTTVPLD